MHRIQEMAQEAHEHIAARRDERGELPFEIQVLITEAHNVCIDIAHPGHNGEGELDLEEADEALTEVCEKIDDYVRRIQDTDRSQCAKIGEILRPVNRLSTALNHDASL